MKRSKWFSLIEILIVLSIILVFLIVFQGFFKTKDMHIYSWQRCVNDLYSFINTFVNQWLTSKWFNSWSVMVYPTKYSIQLNYTENKITEYISWSIERGVVYLSWTSPSQKNICYINGAYNMLISWNLGEVRVTKWSNSNQFEIILTNWEISTTAYTDLFLCKSTECMHIWQYLADIRNQTITKRVCLSFSWSDCLQWNQ
jgi:hypothetical protein